MYKLDLKRIIFLHYSYFVSDQFKKLKKSLAVCTRGAMNIY